MTRTLRCIRASCSCSRAASSSLSRCRSSRSRSSNDRSSIAASAGPADSRVVGKATDDEDDDCERRCSGTGPSDGSVSARTSLGGPNAGDGPLAPAAPGGVVTLDDADDPS